MLVMGFLKGHIHLIQLDVRTTQDLEVPQGVSDETLIGHPPEPHEEDVRIKKEPDLKSGFLALSKKGTIKITDYNQNVG